MNKINYQIEIVDDFLNKDDFNELCNLNLSKEFKEDFKVYHNKINDEGIIESTINQDLLKRIHKNYFDKAMNILGRISPKKVNLYEYSDFTIIITKKNSKFLIHDDTPNKLLSGVIYLSPKKNAGTIFYSDKKGSNKTNINWKTNRAVYFSRIERETWHSYEGDGLNDRIVLVYNLMTNKIKDVYKAEKKSYLLGNLRYKINPYLFQIFKKTF
jgi:hypothetical protein